MENLKKELKDLEVQIEQYPLAESPYLIEEFLIMGYTNVLKEEKVINNIKSEISSKKNYDSLNFLKLFTFNHLPTLLSSITSNSNLPLIDTQNIITCVYPIPPKIFYCNSENKDEPTKSKIVFNHIQNGLVNIGYAYCFYEKDIIKLNENEKKELIIYFPKAFVIISQYNYFYTFHKICENLHKQFLSDNIEIPIELQIYNLVNFIPCPLDNKLELIIFPDKELSSIVKCKEFDEYKKLNDINNILILEQLGGYKHSEINFCKILDILSPETIIQTYLQLLCGKTVAFFSENQEKLNYILLIFSHLLFPLGAKECAYGLNPNKYYSSEMLDQFIVGYLTSYMIIAFSDPIPKDSKKKNFLIYEDEKSAQKDRRGFIKGKVKCDFILDIEEGTFKLYEEQNESQNLNLNKEINIKKEDEEEDECDYENDDDDDKEKKQEEIRRNKFLYGYFNSLFSDNLDGNLGVKLDIFIRELYTKIKFLSFIVKRDKLTSLFVEKENINISGQIQEAFVRFNLLISDHYFNIFSTYKGELHKVINLNKTKKEDLNITDAEYFFYDNFEITTNRDMLMNFVGGYGENEPLLSKASKRGFDNLITMYREGEKNSILLKEHLIELLDCTFIKNKNNLQSISFFEFYKYFYDNLRLFVYKNINDDYLDKKVVKKDNIVNYYYKYKKINIDKDLLLKYCCYLDELFDNSEDIKKKLFPTINNNESIAKIISTKDYYNSYDKFLINHKILNLKNIIQFCILNIVILSTTELKLIYFTEPIYALIKKMNLGIRKYVELILNVSYRGFIKNNITNKNEVNKNFDIYKIGMEEKKIFPNDEIMLIEENIQKFMALLTEETKEIPEIIKKIQETEESNLFSFKPETVEKSEIDNEIGENLGKEGEISKKISLKSSLLNDEEISNDNVYYPYTLYLKLNELIDKYYISLDINTVGRSEYNKLIINVIYFLRFIKDDFPEGIFKFLFFCLYKEK